MNHWLNKILTFFGRDKMSFSKKIKNSVKKAVSWIADFEQTAGELAIEKGFDYVICGHIHQPQHRTITNEKGSVVYLNSGDWIENLTSLEYDKGEWNIHQFETLKTQINYNKEYQKTPKVPDVITEQVAFWIQSVL
jgi:UDP-2,3-diacylglucosamine pyrophosphatase LpxH